MSKHYLKSDGNGGFSIGNYTIALITIVLLIVGASIPVIVSAAKNDTRLDALEDRFEEASPRHTETINKLESRLDTNEKNIAVINNKLDNINQGINDIKQKLNEVK